MSIYGEENSKLSTSEDSFWRAVGTRHHLLRVGEDINSTLSMKHYLKASCRVLPTGARKDSEVLTQIFLHVPAGFVPGWAHHDCCAGEIQLQCSVIWEVSLPKEVLLRSMQVKRRLQPGAVLSSLLRQTSHLHDGCMTLFMLTGP